MSILKTVNLDPENISRYLGYMSYRPKYCNFEIDRVTAVFFDFPIPFVFMTLSS